MVIDKLSLSSILLETYFEQQKLSYASGFTILWRNNYYLVTNKHVVSGRDPITGKPIDKINQAVPSHLKIWFCETPIDNNFKWIQEKISLYTSDDYNHGKKLWLEHPDKTVDVVLLPLESKPNIKLFPLDLKLAEEDIITYPGMTISLIGFPYGKTSAGKLPFWVTGFTASEFLINQNFFYVNASGREGLSGSPVLLRAPLGYLANKGLFVTGDTCKTKFMGIYSGRIKINPHENNDAYSSDLCIVWKPEILYQILSNDLFE